MKTIHKTGLALVMLFIMHSCQTNSAEELVTIPTPENIIGHTFKTGNGWGYAVYINNQPFIKQDFIPVIAGNKGFANESDANKVAAIVVKKLKNHEKPTIRLKDLEELGIAGRSDE